MLKSSLFPAFFLTHSISPRSILLPLLMLPGLLASCGTTHSVFTIYDLGQAPLPSLRQEISLCRAAGKLVIPDRTLYWLSVGAFYDIQHNSNVAVNNCLLARGWRPKLQFAGPFGAGAGDLELVLKKCGAQVGDAGLPASAGFSGMVAENVMLSGGGAGDTGTELKQCLVAQGWRIVEKPPWISPDDASSSFVVDPIAENIAEKFAAEGKIIKDFGKGIDWLQDCSEGARGFDWYNARRYVIDLNDRHFNGYSDWRIPRRDEVESLIDFARWNGTHDLAKMLKKLGFNGIEGAIYWTSSPTREETDEDGIWGVDFATNEFVRLGRSDFFSANVMPVRGKGWGTHEIQLGLREAADNAGEGEDIAARYHRCKAGNCGPSGRSDGR